jgi:hypothetical protein
VPAPVGTPDSVKLPPPSVTVDFDVPVTLTVTPAMPICIRRVLAAPADGLVPSMTVPVSVAVPGDVGEPPLSLQELSSRSAGSKPSQTVEAGSREIRKETRMSPPDFKFGGRRITFLPPVCLVAKVIGSPSTEPGF